MCKLEVANVYSSARYVSKKFILLSIKKVYAKF